MANFYIGSKELCIKNAHSEEWATSIAGFGNDLILLLRIGVEINDIADVFAV